MRAGGGTRPARARSPGPPRRQPASQGTNGGPGHSSRHRTAFVSWTSRGAGGGSGRRTRPGPRAPARPWGAGTRPWASGPGRAEAAGGGGEGVDGRLGGGARRAGTPDPRVQRRWTRAWPRISASAGRPAHTSRPAGRTRSSAPVGGAGGWRGTRPWFLAPCAGGWPAVTFPTVRWRQPAMRYQPGRARATARSRTARRLGAAQRGARGGDSSGRRESADHCVDAARPGARWGERRGVRGGRCGVSGCGGSPGPPRRGRRPGRASGW
ncbi:hypothetical protein SDIAM103S_01848 [Streptomyces diastaticus subsp. diastaticus]